MSKLTTSVNRKNKPDSSLIHGAYLHIPFCRRRCYYCDFPISVLGDIPTPGTLNYIEQYVNFLVKEITATPNPTSNLTTIFFGGGTPSLLPVKQLEKILSTLDQHFGIATEAEISLEIDPGTFNLNQIQDYRHLGVNRVSLGVQAFQDELLQVCGRSHSRDDIFVAVDLIRQVGIDNFSVDLISGLPHQSAAQWQNSLQAAIEIAPKHISCYDLVLEPVTAFGKQYQPGSKPLPDDVTTADMYRQAQQILTTAGYEHYEISNYAQKGFQCCHNRVYWENLPYYGFGMGAASYVNNQRFTRPRTRKEYYTWLEQGAKITSPPLTSQDVLLEKLMLGLRLAEGVNLEAIREQFGEEALQTILTCLQPYQQRGWVEVKGKNQENLSIGDDLATRIHLSDPEGFLFSNTLLADLFNQLDDLVDSL